MKKLFILLSFLFVFQAYSGTHIVDNSGNNVVIGTDTPSANADLTLEGGVLCLKETTTPTADTGYGKFYIKDDNKPYIQDGDGVEHEVCLLNGYYGEMYLEANTTASVIDTADVWHTVSVSEITVGLLSGWTYADGVTGSDITTYATYDGGDSTLVTTTADHGLSDGDFITITGTTNYNDIFEILSAPTTKTFEIDKAWDTNNDATGTYGRGGTLTAGTGVAGTYTSIWNISFSPSTNNEIFTGAFLVNGTVCPKCRAREFGQINTQYGHMGGSSLIPIAEGDKIQFIIKNIGSIGNVVIRHANVNLKR